MHIRHEQRLASRRRDDVVQTLRPSDLPKRQIDDSDLLCDLVVPDTPMVSVFADEVMIPRSFRA